MQRLNVRAGHTTPLPDDLSVSRGCYDLIACQNGHTAKSGGANDDPVVQIGHIVNADGRKHDGRVHWDDFVIAAMGYDGYEFRSNLFQQLVGHLAA